MDKRIIFAVAGAGKTTSIVNGLSTTKRSLILTYTVANYTNLKSKILEKFNNQWPKNICLMTYFSFLYSFCYKPLFADIVKAKGIIYDNNKNRFEKSINQEFYINTNGYFYSNRLAYFLERYSCCEINERIAKYFDELVIDEIQDISSRDFNFILALTDNPIKMLFVGDFYQHTFDTSTDGNVNKNLFYNYTSYKDKFLKKGFVCDEDSLIKSWRCGAECCDFIRENFGIQIESHYGKSINARVIRVDDISEIEKILGDDSIVKLHYENAGQYGLMHRNWGEVKGEDSYHDICVLLNPTTETKFQNKELHELPPSTRSKLYVALTRARGNVYLVNERVALKNFKLD